LSKHPGEIEVTYFDFSPPELVKMLPWRGKAREIKCGVSYL
jgi:hypothetical protein